MRHLAKAAGRGLKRLVGTQNLEAMLTHLASLFGLDLLGVAHHQRGIMKYENAEVSGERHLIESILPRYLRAADQIMFDIGANQGVCSKQLRHRLPTSAIYAFEPNAETFRILESNLASDCVRCFNLGFGSDVGRGILYHYADNRVTSHASMYEDVLLQLHGSAHVAQEVFEMTTLDRFCESSGIGHIDFLKIDTEGHELEVLKGGASMLSEDRIDIIQFEFNEMNVISRVFLRDFYELLTGFDIYRLDTHRLIPMPKYRPADEIFLFQNLVAIRRDLLIQSSKMMQAKDV
jgi:FkbM family methyltransferase